MPVDPKSIVTVEDLEYTKQQTDGGIAPVETSSTASRAYSTGQRFWFKGKLCICTNDIASGGTITLNTNCVLDVLGDDLTAQSDRIDDLYNTVFGITTRNFVEDKNISRTTATLGQLVDDEGKCVSEFISYTWTGDAVYFYNESSGDYTIAFYDSSKNCLKAYQGNTSQPRRKINADTGVTGTVAYVRFSFKKGTTGVIKSADTDDATVYWTAVSTTTDNLSSDVDALQEDVTSLRTDVDALQEAVYPEWFAGEYRETGTVYFPSDNSIVRTDYIAVGDALSISERENYYVRVSKHGISGSLISRTDWTLNAVTVTSTDCAFVRIEVKNLSGTAITSDPNTIGLNVSITRKGICHIFNTEFDAIPNDPNMDLNQVLPKYLVLCACREKFTENGMIETVGYLYRTCVSPYKLYYASGRPDNVRYLCDWNTTLATTNTAAARSAPNYYSFAVTDEGDIICVYRGEIVSTYPRANPIVYPHGDYSNPVIVSLETKPTAWISNSGMYTESGEMWFGEYIRSWHEYAYVWKVVAPYTNAANWTIQKTYERDSDPSDPSSMVLGKIEHIHCVEKDPFTGIIYVTTGDHYTEARIDYLNDDTWGVLEEANEGVCRQLNFIFTPTYVYWASDASAQYDPDQQEYVNGAHKFFRATRDANGLIDLDNVESYSIPDLHASTVTYHTCYVKDPECILILDRHESSSVYCEIPFRVWNIKKEQLEIAGTIRQTEYEDGLLLGFRAECCQHYPNEINGDIAVGFSLYPNTIDACGNPAPDLGENASGMSSDDSVNVTQVNSLTLKVTRS